MTTATNVTTVSAARLVATLPLAMLSVAMLWQVASHGLTPLLAQEPDRAALELFEKRIRPALVQHCYECHRADVAEGKLALDSREGLRRGGESGPAIVPGDPDRSLLIRSLRHADPKLKMPKDAPRLADNVIAEFAEWVRRGAVDPRDQPDKATPADTQMAWRQKLAERRSWWSFQPPVRRSNSLVLLVAARNGAAKDGATNGNKAAREFLSNPIDQFLLARMNEAGLEPASAADARDLFRRLTLVVTGLPPSLDDMDDFVAEYTAAERRDGTTPSDLFQQWAVERAVDRLLASPAFGERWARHWMDLVRYCDTHGSEQDALVPHAWRYRDYAVRAWNGDLPYDRFVAEHLAGDLLAPRWNRELGINESPIGTAWWRFVEFYHTPVDPKNEEAVVIESQLDALGKTFLGLTLACARCHDHKFDPISQRDYTALYGVCASARTTMHRLDDPASTQSVRAELAELKRELRTSLADVWRRQIDTWPNAIAIAAQPAAKDAPAPTTQPPQTTPSNPTKQSAPPAKSTSSPDADSLAKSAVAAWQRVLATDTKPGERSNEKPGDPIASFAPLAVLTRSPLAESWAAGQKAVRDESEQAAADVARGRFRTIVDFSDGQLHGWHATGGFAEFSRPGALSVFPGGELILSGFYPSGRYSHLLSERTGGALRSPNFTLDMAFLSAQVTGLDSRLRLVIENFEGNDLLYSQVTPRLGDRGQTYWVTLPIRDNWRGRRAYLELVPRDDVTNVGVVKETAKWGNDGRSSAGLCRVVAHDSPGAPPPTSTIPSAIWRDDAASPTPPDWKILAERLTALTRDALDAWLAERMTDEQARWLLSLLRAGLLDNSASSSAGPVALRYRAKEQSLPIPQRVVGVTDEESIDERVFARGDSRRPGDVQPRRFLELLGGRAYSAQGSGRRELAEDMIRPDNPLVARVIVNRLWQHAFGRGLVASVDNFGQLGDQPTHPELLDWLAIDFVEHGWSLKHALRQMLTSRAFRGSSNATSRQFELDPENRLLARANIRRLEAEALRDAVLVASGRLDRRMGGLSIPVALPTTIADHQKPVSGPLDGAGRRSLYLEVRRNFMSPLLTAFDFPKPVATTGVRNVTNVPAQSLALLNDPLLVEQATLLAHRTIAARPTVRDRAAALHSAVLMRRPADAEIDALVSLAGRLQAKAATEGAQQGTQSGGGPSNSGAPGVAVVGGAVTGGAVTGGAVTGVGAPASDNVLSGESDVAARVWRDVALTLMNLKEFRFVR